MAPRKRAAGLPNGPVDSVVATKKTTAGAPPIPTSKIPPPLRFPLAVILNMSLSSLFYTIASEFTAGDLSSVSRSVNDWPQIFGLVACKILELGVSWFGGFDSYDVLSLTLLTHLPPLVLLVTCYSIRPTTLLSCLFIDLAATSAPFTLLRRLHPAHASTSPPDAVANKSIISDLPTQIFTSLLGAVIYACTLYASYSTFLPNLLATNFTGLRSLSGIYNAQFLTLIVLFLPVGLAAKVLLFTPATASKRDKADEVREKFDPAKATLEDTIWWNVWGWEKRGRVMITRGLVLAGVSFFYGWVQVFASIEGATSAGAAGWSGVWALAGVVTGCVYWWVGDGAT